MITVKRAWSQVTKRWLGVRAIVLAVIIALGINIGSALADTAEGPKPELNIPPVRWSTTITNGGSATSPAQVGSNTIVLFQNITAATTPSILVGMTSAGTCNRPGPVKVTGPEVQQETCGAGGRDITFRNQNLTGPPAILWVEVFNF